MRKSIVLSQLAQSKPEIIEEYRYSPEGEHYLFLQPGWICPIGDCGTVYGKTVKEVLQRFKGIQKYNENKAYLHWHRTGEYMQPDEIKNYRSRLGLTQQKTAQLLNTPLRTYQKWEQGKAIPSAAAVELMTAIQWLNSRELLPEYLQSR